MDIIHVIQMWILFMCVRFGYYYASQMWIFLDVDIICVSQMWILIMCVRCGYYLCESDVDM